MSYAVIILPNAEEDLKEIHSYLVNTFSRKEWLEAYKKIKHALVQLKSFPESGPVFSEVQTLNLFQYRQIMAGINRIVYEIRDNIVYVHIICDSRREMKTLLAKRFFQ